MKKFMFSAIAMIAFVGSSMANTSEIKELSLEVESNLVVLANCSQYAMAATLIETSASQTPMTQQQFNAAYTSNYNFCVNSNNIGAEPLPPVIIRKK